MKLMRIALVTVVISILTTIFSSANLCEEHSWYIKRNGNLQPCLDPTQQMIKNYNAYYLDTSLSDTSEDKKIYLTFDLGYDNGNTERILDTLKKENITAAFFILDNIILKNPELIIRMADEGHLICNHTKNHKNLSKATDEEIIKNLTELENLLAERTGKTMSKFFRFPEGKYSENALKCVNSLGYKTLFWSFAYDDWDNGRQPSQNSAIKKVLSNTHNGAIMLFHPTSKTNADIFPTLISEWRKMGYEFGKVDEI